MKETLLKSRMLKWIVKRLFSLWLFNLGSSETSHRSLEKLTAKLLDKVVFVCVEVLHHLLGWGRSRSLRPAWITLWDAVSKQLDKKVKRKKQRNENSLLSLLQEELQIE